MINMEKIVKIWEMDNISYFNGIGLDEKTYNQVILQPIFNYVCKLSFENDKEMWWNDDIGMCFTTSGIMTFIIDFIEQHPTHEINIECKCDVVNVSINCAGCFYCVTDYFDNDAHNKIFEMVIWVIAKSLGFEEGE